MNKLSFTLSVVFANLLSVTSADSVLAADCDACCLCQEKKCKVTVGTEEVDVECYEVECEDICIPPVRFWWECGPLKQCGKIRTVRKLVAEKVGTKKVCTYDWEVVTMCGDCYRKIHRLRCDELHVGYDTTAEKLGLPVPDADGAVRFQTADRDGEAVDAGLFFAPIKVAVPLSTPQVSLLAPNQAAEKNQR